MTHALIELRGVERDFIAGDLAITVLKQIDLTIHRGEMVAIMGTSGSGKSTLMNILGCLDRPTRGTYRMRGREVHTLSADELATLRREHFGFVFQRYQLLAGLTAWQNVEIPAIYAGMPRARRRARAHQLLQSLGLRDRADHRPAQLSGGQQQRVSIARALMNGGNVILADEPTGALDTRSGHTVLRMLRQLNAAGHTVIMVTHDPGVARHANRIVEIQDGRIVEDRGRDHAREPVQTPGEDIAATLSNVASLEAASPCVERVSAPSSNAAPTRAAPSHTSASWAEPYRAAFGMALLALRAHRLRAFLTMLGIIVGIAAVVAVVALGAGSRELILRQVSFLGANTLEVSRGKDFGDERAASIRSLLPRDAELLARQHFIANVSPQVRAELMARYRNKQASVQVVGVGDQHPTIRNFQLAQGHFFDRDAVSRLAQEAVIDPNTSKVLFGDDASAIGKVILVGDMPVRVIGVLQGVQSFLMQPGLLYAYVPYTTVMHRLLGQSHLDSISVRVSDGVPVHAAEAVIEKVIKQRHGIKDFFTFNNDEVQRTLDSIAGTLTMVMSAIAAISLVVGGAGVMNIMLVSVHERTSEIGVRMAIGARRVDIMRQFLIEAMVVCLAGGLLGMALALCLGPLVSWATGGIFRLIYSPSSMAIAFATSLAVGLAAGYLPARKAARLQPVQALARE
ncbi:Macrolide export ATP-binding/permease protein MacB [Bordetella sputigena]|uniref:MacB family efflux pump subunit n=1 Tax=Bordetella sputigena TaxID=1416810 RepID=UPI0039F0C173